MLVSRRFAVCGTVRAKAFNFYGRALNDKSLLPAGCANGIQNAGVGDFNHTFAGPADQELGCVQADAVLIMVMIAACCVVIVQKVRAGHKS